MKRDPEIVAMIGRLTDAGVPESTVEAAARYADADAAYSELLRQAFASVGVPMAPERAA